MKSELESTNNKLQENIIEQQKQLEAKNRELEAMNSLLQESQEVINNYADLSKTDLKGNITYVSKVFCETTGYTKEELIGRPHNIVRSDRNDKEIYEKLWSSLNSDQIFKGIIENKTKDGEYIWFDTMIKPEYDINNKKVGYVAYRKNITYEKNLQMIIDDQIEQIREKDKQIQEQAKIEAMAKMIQNISHQWRQPLSVISTVATGMILELEYDMFEKNKAIDSLQKLDESAQFLSKTIDDFRDFFINHNTKRRFDFSDTLNRSLDLLESSFISDGIEVVKDFKVSHRLLFGYENELTQALLNISTNAKEALNSIDGKKYLFISTDIEDKNLIINISNNAGGIDEAIIQNIFEPYFTTKHQSQGKGMGLYVAREIISRHFNGTITVKNININYNDKVQDCVVFKISIPFERV